MNAEYTFITALSCTVASPWKEKWIFVLQQWHFLTIGFCDMLNIYQQEIDAVK